MSDNTLAVDMDREEAVDQAHQLFKRILAEPGLKFGLYAFENSPKTGGTTIRALYDLDELMLLVLAMHSLHQVEGIIVDKNCPCVKCDTRLTAIGQAIHALSTVLSDRAPAPQVSH